MRAPGSRPRAGGPKGARPQPLSVPRPATDAPPRADGGGAAREELSPDRADPARRLSQLQDKSKIMFRSSLDIASPTTPYRGSWAAGHEHEEEAKVPPEVEAT